MLFLFTPVLAEGIEQTALAELFLDFKNPAYFLFGGAFVAIKCFLV
jgi:hypothetical protein